MSRISSAQLDQMRHVQAQYWPGTAIVQRAGTVADGMGGLEDGWSAVGTVAGRLYPLQSRAQPEVTEGNQPISITRWYFTYSATSAVDITAADRMEISGRTYEVLAVNTGEDYRTAFRVELVAHNQELRT